MSFSSAESSSVTSTAGRKRSIKMRYIEVQNMKKNIRFVDQAFASGEEESVIDERARERTEERSHNWAPDPVLAGRTLVSIWLHVINVGVIHTFGS